MKTSTSPAPTRNLRKPVTAKTVPAATQDLILRATALRELPLEYLQHSSFEHPEVSETLGSLTVELRQHPGTATVPPGLPAYLASLYETPLLTKFEEENLFARMNYLRYRADQLRQKLDLRRPSRAKIEEVENLLSVSLSLRNQILQANLRLVVGLAKKFAKSRQQLEELISEGHLPLLRAVELFDFSRGFRFSTYATWAVRNHFVRTLQDQQKIQERYRSSETILSAAPERAPGTSEPQQNRLRKLVAGMLDQLPPREQQILAARFGLRDQHPQTLAEIGADLGISKERVRQITLRGMARLKEFSAEAGHGM